MAADRPVMLLLIDENVPLSVAEVFALRGHDVRYAGSDPGKWREVHVGRMSP